MKSDEDVWISRRTEASRPDELGPDEAAGCLSEPWKELERQSGRGRARRCTGRPAGAACAPRRCRWKRARSAPMSPGRRQFPDLPPCPVFPGRACVSGVARRTWCG